MEDSGKEGGYRGDQRAAGKLKNSDRGREDAVERNPKTWRAKAQEGHKQKGTGPAARGKRGRAQSGQVKSQPSCGDEAPPRARQAGRGTNAEQGTGNAGRGGGRQETAGAGPTTRGTRRNGVASGQQEPASDEHPVQGPRTGGGASHKRHDWRSRPSTSESVGHRERRRRNNRPAPPEYPKHEQQHNHPLTAPRATARGKERRSGGQWARTPKGCRQTRECSQHRSARSRGRAPRGGERDDESQGGGPQGRAAGPRAKLGSRAPAVVLARGPWQ